MADTTDNNQAQAQTAQPENLQAQNTAQTAQAQPETQATQDQGAQDKDSFANAYGAPDNANNANGEQGQKEQNTQEQPKNPDDEVPETYTFKDQNGNEINDTCTEDVQECFKEAKLTKKQADILLNAYRDAVNKIGDFEKEQRTQMTDAWYKQVKNDPELGGNNLNNTKMMIGRVMERFGNQELRDYLNQTGLGYSPAMVRFVTKIGEALGNDADFVTGRGVSHDTEYDRNKRLYPNSPELWGNR